MDLREPLIEATKKLRALRAELDQLQYRVREPIAIVAVACRLPGGVDGPESYWRLLEEGRDAVTPFPRDRWDTEALFATDPDAPGRTYCGEGGFVDGVDQFDPEFFGIAPREAEGMDPAQRLVLECVWEALERAGIPPAELLQSQTGVYLGAVGTDYEPWGGSQGMAGMDGHTFTGRDSSVLSGRVSYTLGLQGPAMTVNTACSSSLVALHLACKALRSGECDLALCGGSQVMTTPAGFVEFSRLRGVAPDGRCKSFSDAADGTGWAEGCGVLLLQRLSDAQREGRPILAVVRGTAVNHDGRSQGLTAPNGPSQERVIRRALEESGLTSADIDAVEAHGTGTPLGDPIELGALGAVFGPGRPKDRPLYLGSSKSNLGHTQAAAGAASVIKMVLALQKQVLPATLHAESPTRQIAWEGSGLSLLREGRSWPRGSWVRRAGVSSFGISGTNAHVILEEAPAPERVEPSAVGRSTVPLLVSGADGAALRAQVDQIVEHLDRNPVSALDLTFSLATTRSHFPARLAVSVPADAGPRTIAAALRAGLSDGFHHAEGRPGKLVMLFSGEGNEHWGMGRELHERFPLFRETLNVVCAELDRWLPLPLLQVMFGPTDPARYAAPAWFALETALYRQWEQWGPAPDLLIGHGVGEIVVAHVGGKLSLAEACERVVAGGGSTQDDPEVAVRAAESAGADTWVECGPPGGLGRLVGSVPLLQAGTGEGEALTDAFTRIHRTGRTVDWSGFFAGLGARRVDLPTYPFQRSRHWLAGAGGRQVGPTGGHPVLGDEISLADGGSLFTARLVEAAVPWLTDHQVLGQVVVPGVFLVDLLLTVGRRLGAPQLESVVFLAALIVPPTGVNVQIVVDPGTGPRAFRIHGRTSGDGAWTLHATGTLGRETPVDATPALWPPADATPIPLAGLYERLAGQGSAYGPAFRCLREAYRRDGELYGRVVLPHEQHGSGFAIHPALLDAGLHLMLADADPVGVRVPFVFEGVRRAERMPPPTELRVHLVPGNGASRATVSFRDPTGGWVATIGTVDVRPLSVPAGPSGPYRIQWIDRPLPAAGEPEATAVVGSGPLADQVAAALRSAGSWVIRSETWDGLRELLDGGRAEVATVVRVVDPGPGEDPADAALRMTVGLVEELRDWTWDSGLADHRYVLVTSDGLADAALWGLFRSVRSEHPDRRWTLLDTDGTPASEEVLAAAVAAGDEAEAVLRVGERRVPRLVPVDPPQSERRLDPDGTVLVTGGTGGLGAAVAKHLAIRHGVTRLVLTSRRGPAAPGAGALVQELAALGCTATVEACDVSDRAAVAALLENVRLTAVFHCAAVVDDHLVGSLPADAVARVFAPKARGGWNLHQLTRDHDLAAFVSFSSIAGLLGNEGQGAYAAANTFLDALCVSRQALGLPALSLVWGPWAEVGMAARLSPLHRARLGRAGVVPMTPAAALEQMDRALHRPEPVLVLVEVDRDGLQDATGLLRSLVGDVAPRPVVLEPSEPQSFRSQLDAASPGERGGMLLGLVRTEVAAMLKLPDPGILHPDRPLEELGMDSLMAVDIRRRLEQRLVVLLPPTVVFDHPSCGALADHLLESWNGVRTPNRDESEELLELVRQEVAAVLQLRDPGVLHPERQLEELGMDSLMAVDIRRRLEKRLGVQLSATLVLDHPSCGSLAAYLLNSRNGSEGGSVP